MQKIRITNGFNYLEGIGIVQMYFIQGIPFTFEELPESLRSMEEVQLDADTARVFTMQDLYTASDYLVMEGCHPILFDLSDWIENYEEVPD
tara:strand:+ start:5043 stop:5315 length:273 start_codon:yes stop_codon:yes gene_type:complete